MEKTQSVMMPTIVKSNFDFDVIEEVVGNLFDETDGAIYGNAEWRNEQIILLLVKKADAVICTYVIPAKKEVFAHMQVAYDACTLNSGIADVDVFCQWSAIEEVIEDYRVISCDLL